MIVIAGLVGAHADTRQNIEATSHSLRVMICSGVRATIAAATRL